MSRSQSALPSTGDEDGAPPGGRIDLRLGGFAAGTWLTAWAALYLPASVALAAAVAATLAAVLVWPRGWRAAPAIVAVLLGVVGGATATAARTATRDDPRIAALARHGSAVRADLVLTDDPRPVRGSGHRLRAYVLPADLRRLVSPTGGTGLSVRVVVLASDPAWRALLPGQRVVAVGRLGPPRGGDLRAATLSVRGPPRLIGAPPWYQRLAGRLRAGLQRASAVVAGPAGGLLPGLVLGDTSRLDASVADDFRSTGMTHLVAVSGANCAIVMGLVLAAARWCRAGPVLAAASSGVALAGFVILARPSPSVLRAAAMGAIGLVGLASGRPRAALPGLAAVVAALVVLDPELADDAGFALSVFATGGLLLLAPGWRDALCRRGVPRALAEALAVPAAAQVACAPLIAGLSASVSLAAVPANLLAAPAVTPATILGVGAAVASPVWPPAASVLAWLAGWPARWLVEVATVGARVPAGIVPWPGGGPGAVLLAFVSGLVLYAGRRPALRRAGLVIAVGAVLGALPVRIIAGGWPPPGWILVACDVGQGDALVLPAGPGQAVVVDTGPDPGLVDRCLRRLDVTRVPLLVLTHFHADHVDGVTGVFAGRRVDAVIASSFLEPGPGYRELATTAGRHGTPLAEPRPGASYDVGDVHLEVLAPTTLLAGTTSDPNNNSLILRARIHGITIMLPGDAQNEEQQTLLAAGVDPRADVLKVAHHGSAYQDQRFLDAVAPAVAVVSVGAHNDYGHPNPGVLARLARAGARVLRTDTGGDVAVTVDAEGRLAVATRGRSPGARPP